MDTFLKLLETNYILYGFSNMKTESLLGKHTRKNISSMKNNW